MGVALTIILCVLAVPVLVFTTVFVRQLRAGGGKAMSFGKSRRRNPGGQE